MLAVLLIGLTVVILTVMTHYAALRAISNSIMLGAMGHPLRVGAVVCLALLAHCVEIMLFAVGFHGALALGNTGSINGEFAGHFVEIVYFSFVSYTSLGLGDVYPLGPVRLLTGIEALTGLVMIGWTASFTYFCMSESWTRPQ